MAEYSASQITIANGSKAVVINSGESPENVRQGDFLFVTGSDPVAINRTYINDNGQHVIELTKNWGQGNKNNQPAIVLPSTAEYKAVADALKNANLLVNDNFVAMQDWQTKTGTVTFVNIDGTTTTVKTLKQIESEAQAQLDAYHPHPWAMRKVEFEARRAANNEKFAASGFVHFGKHGESSGNIVPVNQGMWVHEAGVEASKALHFGRRENYIGGISKTENPIINIAGVLSVININHYSGDIFNDKSATSIKFPPAEDGTRTYDSATGISVTHATPAIAFASETDTNKVVTDRVDAWGFEAFLREINDTDPFVYDKGLIQSQATNINGVATVTDNVRPDTYFAWYEGDDSSTGKGVNWQTATEAQRTAIASNPDNNIYFDDATGKFYQWCVRGRSFAGVGNGDWEELSVSGVSALTPKKNVNMYLHAQGGINAITSYGSPSTYFIPPNDSGKRTDKSKLGHWTGQGSALQLSVIEGHCYFLICGTVNRLNQGAYHPSYNPLGSGRVSLTDNNSTSNGNDSFWYADGGSFGTNPFLSGLANNLESCFKWGDPRGSIAGQRSGRADNRFFDAIYASGQGGVCRDMRYSAWGLTQEDFAEADLAIKSGEYHGREGLLKTYVIEGQLTVAGSSRNIYIAGSNLGALATTGAKFYVVSSDGTVQSSRVGSTGSTGFISDDTLNNLETVTHVIVSSTENVSISGKYTYTEVIGDPSNILLCDDLKDGWVGGWNPEIPDGTNKEYRLTKKQEGSAISVIYSDDLGETWRLSSTVVTDAAKNILEVALPADALRLWIYTAKAKMTEFSENSEIYGGAESVKNVSFYSDRIYSALQYSLIDKIPTQRNWLNILENIPLNSFNIFSNKLSLSGSPAAHSVINPAPPANNSSAFKTLNYNVVENQQGFINYAYTELTYDDAASDWGDDGKIHITDNQATRLDDNGNSVVYGTARIVEPLGWIKNDK
ncbi:MULTISPECIES: hypothetical protein [unclassified Pseudoalteromonas]|uniref:hypothetical protein n=1 Tax=unclassified Pseudoalteromonas TaxID=194690 RepID=UPI002359A1C0|nr:MULTISPECIES: hypothetical protein [unclassified Pseudoalteromonas]MDC9565557.1 hypothetical protein [Pseudoalteromonas sp. GAB2316C]MDC9569888.1 hypothetical protein [Pseudoalteromonas sp. GABNB9D]MDC9573999.1 hypothetical protein [Pseudoalteromonas sp. GABNS16A]MDC9578405.1 hypothetical protein [Pseudoalteromonas sp. GABNS16E]MDC9585977.1 hypothetical protein [Pseudoalteromonas sp. GABNS16C]